MTPPRHSLEPTEAGRAFFDYLVPFILLAIPAVIGAILFAAGHAHLGFWFLIPVGLIAFGMLPWLRLSRIIARRLSTRENGVPDLLQSLFEETDPDREPKKKPR